MSDTDDDLLELAILLRLRNRKRRPREFGVHPIRRTKQHGHYIALLRDLKLDDREFRKYTRMSRETFTDLLGRVEAGLTKRSRRESINPEQRLLICLRYLATGESFRSLSFSYYLGESTVGAIVHETCKVLVEVLKPEFLVTPSTTDEWLAVAGEFWERWQLPNTLGAIDGKHVRLKCPAKSGSLWYNYKGFFSSVLLVIADANYRIRYASVGSYGHEGDAGIYDRSDLAAALEDPANPLSIPGPQPLPDTNTLSPFFIVADDAFPLKTYMMKPYTGDGLSEEKRVYNYR
ncbi:hypothetical protein AAVH_32716 [Aphelenchoides avenae]|nr:hypothetical protein AAVH_32716 [Aphelenchus avenae]